jgi:cell division protein FtsB
MQSRPVKSASPSDGKPPHNGKLPLPKRKRAIVSALGPALAVVILVAMVSYAVFGPTGLYAWGDYRQSLAKEKVELERLKAEEARLQNRTRLVDPRHADPDLVDELVRKELNVNEPGEVIIPRNRPDGETR